ncbi:MAG: tRNA 4-thiouridine(8) synthase ThiI [Desulfobacterales bacterium]|nr:tRNA 4-thiouridine(8) synthase ThiI [Desulfobacterales bacterium]
MKAIALLSGGLDSTLAAKIILEQGIELEALNFLTVFCNCTHRGETCLASKKAVEGLGIPLRVLNVSEEYLAVVKHPNHGYGRNMNPCIDCRIFMLKKTKEYMETSGTSFIITGEVLGQRPMSQRREAMRLIEKEAGLEGFIVRPLSAKFLPATIPEERGWVDRERLLNISGRSRKPQIKMAEQFGIRDYPCPAGGCLLTDPGFARRMRDLMVHRPDFSLNDVHLLKIGRHFRLSPSIKLVVGRNEDDNQKIQAFSKDGDLLMMALGTPGPLALLRGGTGSEEIEKAAAITVRYGKAKDMKNVEVQYRRVGEDADRSLWISPVSDGEIKECRIGE